MSGDERRGLGVLVAVVLVAAASTAFGVALLCGVFDPVQLTEVSSDAR